MASLLPSHLLHHYHHRCSALAAIPNRFFHLTISSSSRTKSAFSASQNEFASRMFSTLTISIYLWLFCSNASRNLCLFFLNEVGDLEFEAPLEIVKYPDPKLRKKNKRIGTFDDNLKKLVDEMFDVMYK